MKNITEILKFYAKEADLKNWSNTYSADLILKEYPNFPYSHRTIRRKISELRNIQENNEMSFKDEKNKDLINDTIEIIEESDIKTFNYKGERSLTSKEDAIKFFNIDLKKEEIYKSKFNSWDVTLKAKNGEIVKKTNYQVTLFTRKKEEPITKQKINELLLNFKTKKYENFNNDSTGIGVACITDIHIGASTDTSKGLINTPKFDLNILIDYLSGIAQDINNKNKKEVHIAILGDLIESFSGTNHSNSWQELEAHGSNAVIIAYKVLSEFLHSIKNIKRVYLVTGNHDRSSGSDKELDRLGNVSQIIAFMLSKDFDIVFKPLVVSQIIDNISYIFTHGHFGIAKQSLSKIILDYGNQNYYNVICQGHLHSRQTKKEFFKQEYTHMDSVNYRGITVAPVFTGNFYSESNGWTSSAGYSFITANNKKNNINHYDISI